MFDRLRRRPVICHFAALATAGALITTGSAATASVTCFRAVLASPGGELPFGLEIRGDQGTARAVILNGEERIAVPSATLTEESLELAFDHYASKILARRVATHDAAGSVIYEGTWTKVSGPDTTSSLPFRATRADGADRVRFLEASSRDGAAAIPLDRSIAGEWAVTFHGAEAADDGDDGPAVARFRHDAKTGRVLGTFLTPVGDYRYLEGDVRGGRLRLSCFDGAHAFLFHAMLDPDGTRLRGDFWSRDSWHETWTAVRLTGQLSAARAALPDPFDLTTLQPGRDTLEGIVFPDLDGRPVALTDPRFRGKVLVVEIFGSWCPNCHDAARTLVKLRKRYPRTDLAIVGLAYEMTGDAARDAEQVRRYAARHGCDWPILLAGTSPKDRASRTLPALSGVKAYPTTLFVGRDGRVRRIYTGFAGPATEGDHADLERVWRGIIDDLIAERP